MKTWGEPGTDPGQFNIVHNIATDADGWVYVADRENHRVQVFDGNGKYETQWNNLHRPCALCCCGGKQPTFIIGELGPGMPVNLKSPNLGPRLTVVDAKGNRIARLGGENGAGIETGKFLAPHGIAVDSRGDIYLGEVGVTNWKTSFPDTPMPPAVGSRAACRSWRRFTTSLVRPSCYSVTLRSAHRARFSVSERGGGGATEINPAWCPLRKIIPHHLPPALLGFFRVAPYRVGFGEQPDRARRRRIDHCERLPLRRGRTRRSPPARSWPEAARLAVVQDVDRASPAGVGPCASATITMPA